MTRRLLFLDAADADLDRVYEQIRDASQSATVAERFVDRLLDKCEHLATLPGTLGRPRPELRSAPYEGYVIFFRYEGDALEVVNILEGGRDIDAWFDDEARGV